jgi:hypothetical protein
MLNNRNTVRDDVSLYNSTSKVTGKWIDDLASISGKSRGFLFTTFRPILEFTGALAVLSLQGKAA